MQPVDPYGQPAPQQINIPAQNVQPQMAQPMMQGVAQPMGQPVMGQPMMGQPMMVGGGYPPTSATLALVFSIIGLISSFIYGFGICFAIPAFIIAGNALNITNQFPGHPDAGSAKTAKIISLITIVLTVLVIVLVVGAGILYVWASSL